jgi:hypothetical protein
MLLITQAGSEMPQTAMRTDAVLVHHGHARIECAGVSACGQAPGDAL